MSVKMPHSFLKVNNYSLMVHLGCTAEERATPQEVQVSVRIAFAEAPPGEKTDQLGHTVCYAEICERFKEFCENKEFQLVEKLGADLLAELKKVTSNKAELQIYKVHPPVQGLHGGVEYVCGDLI